MSDIKIPRFQKCGIRYSWDDPEYEFNGEPVYNMDPDRHGPRKLFSDRIYASYHQLAYGSKQPVEDFVVLENYSARSVDIVDKAVESWVDDTGMRIVNKALRPIRFVNVFSIPNAKLKQVADSKNRADDQTRMESTVFNMIQELGFDDKPIYTSNRFYKCLDSNYPKNRLYMCVDSDYSKTGVMFKTGTGRYALLYLHPTKMCTTIYTIKANTAEYETMSNMTNLKQLKEFLIYLKKQRDEYLQLQYGTH